jgi:hypothetical protein
MLCWYDDGRFMFRFAMSTNSNSSEIPLNCLFYFYPVASLLLFLHYFFEMGRDACPHIFNPSTLGRRLLFPFRVGWVDLCGWVEHRVRHGAGMGRVRSAGGFLQTIVVHIQTMYAENREFKRSIFTCFVTAHDHVPTPSPSIKNLSK